MKKNFFGAVLVLAIAVGAMTNVNLNKVGNHTGNLALANVDAIASCEMSDKDGKVILCWDGPGTCVTTYKGFTLICEGTRN